MHLIYPLPSYFTFIFLLFSQHVALKLVYLFFVVFRKFSSNCCFVSLANYDLSSQRKCWSLSFIAFECYRDNICTVLRFLKFVFYNSHLIIVIIFIIVVHECELIHPYTICLALNDSWKKFESFNLSYIVFSYCNHLFYTSWSFELPKFC